VNVDKLLTLLSVMAPSAVKLIEKMRGLGDADSETLMFAMMAIQYEQTRQLLDKIDKLLDKLDYQRRLLDYLIERG